MLRACQSCGIATPRTRCPQCERAWQAKRNARPERRIYGGDWPAESRRIRAEQPWCSACGSESSLTVDHPTRAVLCRPCHAKLENARRRGLASTGSGWDNGENAPARREGRQGPEQTSGGSVRGESTECVP